MNSSIPFGAQATADDVLAGLDLSGQTILITGCNSGIGFETMRALVAHGAHVIGLARSFEVARDACARAGERTTPVACDLGDLGSVAVAVETVYRGGRMLDAVIANAGIMCPKALEIRYGVELQFLVNHIGHFSLVNRLAERVTERTGRIVIVSSSASIEQTPKEGIMFDNLDGSRFYKPFIFYGQSKLANALFAKELSRRLTRKGIAVNALHPGAVGGTSLQRQLGFPFNAILSVARLFMKSIAQGAATQTLLAASPLVEGVTGAYWSDCQVAKGHALLADPAIAQHLWSISERIVAAPANIAA
ncbi:MAG TPA: SDR family NAD(P)-dependent oxidoreductase [Polyangiaceae bacterium]|nr:SDR family NAD(P)-dependent oxidoreductase [Polyangiaceae bacterium]